MTRKPKVLAVICNWNKKDDVLACISSVKGSNYPDFDILAVDNASTDGSAAAIREVHPDIYLVENSSNEGSAGGFNAGLKWGISTGRYRYLHLLDNDVIVSSDAMTYMVRALERDQTIAFAGSQILVMDESDKVQELGGSIDWKHPRIIMRGNHADRNSQDMRSRFVDYVAACSMMVRTEAVVRVGLMDPLYFYYYDDIDWATRAIIGGYRIRAVASSKVWHKRGAADTTSTAAIYYGCRNEGYFFNRYLFEDRWVGSIRRWIQGKLKALSACEAFAKPNIATVLKKALADLAEHRRGRLESLQLPLRDTGSRFKPKELFSGRRVHILRRRNSADVRRVIAALVPSASLSLWEPGEPFLADALVIPVPHILTEKPRSPCATVETYWMDPYSNVIPCGGAGDKLLLEARQRLRENRETIGRYLMAGLSELRRSASEERGDRKHKI